MQDALKRRIQDAAAPGHPPADPRRTAPATPFELPADLVAREEASTIRRLVTELRQEGMSDNEIRASEAAIRANAHESTLPLAQGAAPPVQDRRGRGIKVEDEDFAIEIEAMAERTGESARRIRSRLEKEGLTDQTHHPDPRAEGHRLDPRGQHGGRRRHGLGRARGSVETLDHRGRPAEVEARRTEEETAAGRVSRDRAGEGSRAGRRPTPPES